MNDNNPTQADVDILANHVQRFGKPIPQQLFLAAIHADEKEKLFELRSLVNGVVTKDVVVIYYSVERYSNKPFVVAKVITTGDRENAYFLLDHEKNSEVGADCERLSGDRPATFSPDSNGMFLVIHDMNEHIEEAMEA